MYNRIIVCLASFGLLASLGCAGIARVASDVCRVPLGGSKAEALCDKVEDLLLKSDETSEEEAE